MAATLIKSATSDGLDSNIITIESKKTPGFAGIQLIGNATEICRDGKERAKTALEQLGYVMPPSRVLVNLAPADIRKDGNHFDLPIAVSLALLLREQHQLHHDPSQWLFAAELSLSGELRPTRGIVSFALSAAASGLKGIVLARKNFAEVAMVTKLGGRSFENFQILAFDHIKDILGWLDSGQEPLKFAEIEAPCDAVESDFCTFDDMLLLPEQRLAAVVIASGMHSAMFCGSPGCGKSMMAERLTSLLPKMDRREHLEALKIQSQSYRSISDSILKGRPAFRSPHHQTSAAAILGTPESPGELSLAHGGILFLDEFPEFRRDIIESLREPLETHKVQVSRARKKVTWFSQVLLVTARNNCPCGFFGSKKRLCSCPLQKRLAYLARLSGPILDRIDIHINFPEFNDDKSSILRALNPQRESQTASMRNQVVAARKLAVERNREFGCLLNRDLKAQHLVRASGLAESEFGDLIEAKIKHGSSVRSVIKSLKVARTIADVDQSQVVQAQHFEQAWRWQHDNAARERGEITAVSELAQ